MSFFSIRSVGVLLAACAAVRVQAEVRELKTTEEAKKALEAKDMPVAIKFYASWCGACKMFKQPFEDAAKAYEGRVACYAVNVDEAGMKDFVKEHSVQALPTVEIVIDGKMHDRFVGAKSKDDVERVFARALEKQGEKKEEAKEAVQKKEEKAEEKPCGACHKKHEHKGCGCHKE